MRRAVAALFATVLLAACANQLDYGPEIVTVPNVDLKRYSGRWYEIGSFPMFFQRQCIADTQANYTMEKDGSVGVHNQCRTREGVDRADGMAETVPASGDAKLRVSFFRPFWADYWIIGLDPNYRWAVVGNPSRRNLWILSRTKSLPEDQLYKAREAAKRQGFDLTLLHYTRQE